ncbi:MAG: AraC family transcriptional regulator [Psychromonas sp.]|nr:AraC family transcriptional regulator [Psychromonas sp.]
MQRIEWVKKLADLIESTLPRVYSMDELSLHIGVSKAHMQRQFKLATGLSIGHYLRNRRLSRAAIDIATTDKRIIDVAMDYDFESQEAFGRAFRKLLGITPKNLKNQPALANNLSTLPLTNKYLPLYPQIQKIKPQMVTIEPLQLNGVLQRYKSYQVGGQDEFDANLCNMWNKFEQIAQAWPEEDRRYFTVECRNACSVDSGDFTMMAMCTGTSLPDPELISFTLPQQQMLSFRLTSNEDTAEFATYLYSVYLPENNLHVDRMPVLWESFENGDLYCNLCVAKWQTLDPPKSLTHLDEQLYYLPTLTGNISYQAIPFSKQQTSQRLEYLLDVWEEQLATLCLDRANSNKLLLVGDKLDKPFTPEFEFHSWLLEIDKIAEPQDNLKLPTFSYLRATLTGTLTEIANAIEYIKYCALPEMPFYSVHGYEIIQEVTTLPENCYEMLLLLPVKKR